MIDLSNSGLRSTVINAIKGEENKRRKAESLKRYEVYKERQGRYIIEKLREEFSQKTVDEMRKILSINVAPAIINQLSSIYNNEPERAFSNATEDQQELLERIYFHGGFDPRLRNANRYFKLHSQCAIQVLPSNGKITMRVLQPHQYDVIPSDVDPEIGEVYLVNVFDKFEFLGGTNSGGDVSNPSRGGFSLRGSEIIDGTNQKIGDADDYKAKQDRYEVWSKDFNFIMNGKGEILSEDTTNPIGELPFIDVAGCDKDFEFWIRRTNGIVEFTLDFGKILSDVANVVRLQSYAQAIIASDKEPTGLQVGPDKMIWLQLDPNNPGFQPKFEFVSPSPDLQGSLDFLDMVLRLFLTSMGVDPKEISGKLEAKSYTSGVDRLLAMISKFEASKADMDIFRYVEDQIFKLIKLWSNVYNSLPESANTLDKDFHGPILSDDIEMEVKFSEPQAVQTESEKQDSVIKLLDKNLISRRDAMKKLFGVDDDMADKMMKEIDGDNALRIPAMLTGEIGGRQVDEGADQDGDQTEREPEVKVQP